MTRGTTKDASGAVMDGPLASAAPLSPLDALEALHAASDGAVLATRIVPVPELDGLLVEYSGLSAADRAEMWATCYRKVPKAPNENGVAAPEGDEEMESVPIYEKLYPFLLTRSMRLPGTRTLIYQGARAKPDYINSRNPALLDRSVSIIFELSGLSKGAMETEGNGSGTTQSTGTSTDSPDA